MFKFQVDGKPQGRKQTNFTFLRKACQMHKHFLVHITTTGMLAPTTKICINRTRGQEFLVSLRKYTLAMTLILELRLQI